MGAALGLAVVLLIAIVCWRGNAPASAGSDPSAPPQTSDAASVDESLVPLTAPAAPMPADPMIAAPATERSQIVGPDRFSNVNPLAERWLGPADAATRQRWRLLRPDAKGPVIVRVVDQLAPDRATGAWRVVSQEVMRPDAVMVAVPRGFTVAAVVEQLQRVGFSMAPAAVDDAVVVVDLPEATLDAVPAALARLDRQLPFLEAGPDFLRFPFQTTSNDYSATMWGLENIEAPAAWTVTTGAANVVVAVLDSGMDVNHPDLAPNLWTNPGEIAGNGVDDDGDGRVDDLHGWDFSANSAAIVDNDGHGTHVSGTIGAVGNNGQGVTGVNWNVRLLPLRCGDGTFPDSTLINALHYATALKNLYISSGGTKGANVVAVNASFGGSGFDSAFRTEIADAGTAGIVLVAAAGNDDVDNDTTPTYPASYDLGTVISVAAIHQGSARSGFSNFGPTSVDLGAPGTGIYSTLPNGAYGFLSGTSMATPHVTGAVALVAAANPSLTASQLRARILDNVDPVPALAGEVFTGGKLNVRRAVMPALLRPRVIISSPAARVIAMDRAGLGIALAATILPDTGQTAVATLAWDAPDGPAGVSFSAMAGATTVATFPVPGRYTVRVRATAGTLTESDTIVVAVGSFTEPDATGLHAWWHFDETSGTAADSSGDARTGTLSGVARASGVLGSAVALDGSTGNVSFASPALSRVTIAGWVRATGAGNSIFPRIVHMREGLLFFGLDGGNAADDGNNNTLKFALDDGSTTPVWHTPPGTIATNSWYHVAVTYDPTVASPVPHFYINGDPQVFGTQPVATGSTPTVAAGQGFLGDRGDASREWQGTLDEIRIYNRELSASEIALLGHEVTLHALAGGALAEGTSTDPLAVPLTFTPAATGFGAPVFANTSWIASGTWRHIFTGDGCCDDDDGHESRRLHRALRWHHE